MSLLPNYATFAVLLSPGSVNSSEHAEEVKFESSPSAESLFNLLGGWVYVFSNLVYLGCMFTHRFHIFQYFSCPTHINVHSNPCLTI